MPYLVRLEGEHLRRLLFRSHGPSACLYCCTIRYDTIEEFNVDSKAEYDVLRKGMYGLEACPLRKSYINSLNFVVNRLFVKLFPTSNIDIFNYCRAEFNFNYRVLSLNNVLVNLEINIVHVTIFIVNCCVCDDDHCIIIVINCGLRNNLVKLVKFMFCLFLLPFC